MFKICTWLNFEKDGEKVLINEARNIFSKKKKNEARNKEERMDIMGVMGFEYLTVECLKW